MMIWTHCARAAARGSPPPASGAPPELEPEEVLLEELPEELPEPVLLEPLLEELVLDVPPEPELLLLAPELEELPELPPSCDMPPDELPLLPLLEVLLLCVPPSSQGFECPEELQAALVVIRASAEATATSLDATVIMRFALRRWNDAGIRRGPGEIVRETMQFGAAWRRRSARGGMRWPGWTDVGRRRPQTDGTPIRA